MAVLPAPRGRSLPSSQLLLPAARDDLEEAPRVEARAADQGAVDVWEFGQRLDVVRLHATAVEDVTPLRRVRPEPLPQPAPDVRVRLLGLLRRRVPAGTDRPYRFVGDDQLRHLG